MATVRWLRPAALAATIALCGMQAGCAEPKVGATLTYEVNRAGDRASAPTNMQGLVYVVNERVTGLGKARALTSEKFAVDVYGDGDGDAESLDSVRRRIETPGVLEFRIMAAPKFQRHQSIIDLAEKLPVEAGDEVRLDEQVVGRWIECDRTEFPNAESVRERGLAARQVGDRVQALALLNDGFNVTGDFLSFVGTDLDEMGKPQVSFSLNNQGAFLFGQLTGKHVPTRTGQRYNLGMILDKRLLSAPTIESKITDRGRVSGNMTEAEVESLVAILSAGRLPYAVREIGVEIGGPAGAADD